MSELDKTLTLIRIAKEGNAAALDQLFDRYADRVLDVVRARMGPQLRQGRESQDIQQSALMSALKGFERFELRDDASFISWLAKIVESTLRNAHRHDHAERRDVDRATPADEHEGPRLAARRDPSPSMDARQHEEREILRDCIHELPESYREIIIRRDLEGHAWNQIIEDLELPSPGAAHMRHHRATQALGVLLQQKGLG